MGCISELQPYTVVFWSYYLQDHYKQSHPGIDKCPIVVTNEEIEFMKSYKYKGEKNDKRKTKRKRLE